MFFLSVFTSHREFHFLNFPQKKPGGSCHVDHLYQKTFHSANSFYYDTNLPLLAGGKQRSFS
jgi:hypothetical protein